MKRIAYREFIKEKNADVAEFCAIFFEYWAVVNGEDLSDEIEVEVLGTPIKMSRIEKALYGYLGAGFNIELVVDLDLGGAICGFLLYRRVCDVVLEVRHMYLEPSYRDTGAGAGLVAKLTEKYPIKKVIFQTRKEAPPELFLKQTRAHRAVLHEGSKLTTWEMNWGDHGRQELHGQDERGRGGPERAGPQGLRS